MCRSPLRTFRGRALLLRNSRIASATGSRQSHGKYRRQHADHGARPCVSRRASHRLHHSAGSLASAKQWLSRRVTLQADGEWHDEFDCPPHWRARSIYFAGPDDAVLELIERNVLDNRIERAFGVGDIRYISEVGFGVRDVLQTQLQLRDTLGLLPFGEPNPRFGPVGDHDGLFILVPADATWRPENRVAPAAAHIVVTADIPTALEIGEHYLVQPRR